LRGRSDWYNFGYNNASERSPVKKLKITPIGNSARVNLPKELLARQRVEKGDELYALETPDGVRLTTYDPEFAAQMEVAEEIMRKDRDILRKLAQ
jgi:putative addiction module antidote